ncbi:hypothetical protein NQ318_014515 [Aromia moschata]|uniref:Mos1 transposase HTH domain-containing protein n=1 Tax=Aromia moschata TaxID=1265417 RepID=A0AAV8YKT0_9CUCU|nr:hypothetical protein NQ318_014515 [Aromia moschata]
MLSVQMEQRVNLKFLVKLGKTFTEAYAMLKVYGNECLSRTQVFERFKRFKEGRDTTEDDSRPGGPSSSKTDENIEKIDRRLSIRGLNEIKGIDKECVRQILHESFNMRKIKSFKITLWLFVTKGTRFESVEAVKANATVVLNQLTEADFQHCFQQWKSLLERCRDRQGGGKSLEFQRSIL